jgi:ferredoxin
MHARSTASTRATGCCTSTIDCGGCEPVCPVEAIYFEDDLPAEFTGYTAVNAAFFTAIGPPGGASRVGPHVGDHNALSPQSNGHGFA